MKTQSVSTPISQGACAFCNAEIAKNKMTQHLKSCKQRLAAIAKQEKASQQPKTHMFHILAEGKYNPQYWLHFEVPASRSLWLLDDFLKDMWIDDLDHLSGFTINGTDYSIDNPDEMFSWGKPAEEDDDEELSEEDKEKEIRELVDRTMSIFIGEYGSNPLGAVPAEWVAEIKKPRSVDELIDFLKAELISLTNAHKAARKDAWNKTSSDMPAETVRANLFAVFAKKRAVEEILEAVEDRSMDASLARVLKVGQKFLYTYDYGSSTYINLKVVAEREGIISDDQESVLLLAQNTELTFTCVVCGKPATQVEMSYFNDNIADSVFCDKCAKKQDEGMMLPIINSPRVGVL